VQFRRDMSEGPALGAKFNEFILKQKLESRNAEWLEPEPCLLTSDVSGSRRCNFGSETLCLRGFCETEVPEKVQFGAVLVPDRI